MKYDIRYEIGEQVIIIPLGLSGIIQTIFITEVGVSYKVRYFWNSKAEEVYFFGKEIRTP